MTCLIQKSLRVDADNGFTHGHFEGHPIVPGAVSLKWMLETLAEALNLLKLERFRIRNFKCLQELPPPCEVTITVYQRREHVYSLELHRGEQRIASVEVDYPMST